MRAFALILAFCFSTAATAFQPRIGLWSGKYESGSGYMIDVQNGIVVLTVFSYSPSGAAQWYLASGPLTDNGRTFIATLNKYTGGQCISCAYRPTRLDGNDGEITIGFLTPTLATLDLPGGRWTLIEAVDFGYGQLPAGFLGEWIFVHDITSTFAQRYNFTTTASATPTGNGLALDVERQAGCELQGAANFQGFLLCMDLDSSNNIENQYIVTYGLDETHGGVWVSPSSGRKYPTKGFRVSSKYSPAGTDASQIDRMRVQAEDAAFTGTTDVIDSATAAYLADFAAALRRALAGFPGQ